MNHILSLKAQKLFSFCALFLLIACEDATLGNFDLPDIAVEVDQNLNNRCQEGQEVACICPDQQESIQVCEAELLTILQENSKNGSKNYNNSQLTS